MQAPPAQLSLPSFLEAAESSALLMSDIGGEMQAAQDGCFISDLSHLAVLEFSGDDATSFLQGQLSCDVEAARNTGHATLGAYCTAKGRMLASFLLWEASGTWRMILSRTIVAPVQKRLGMFVLRAKVRITPASETVLLGLAGKAARNSRYGSVLPTPYGTCQQELVTVIAVPQDRWIFLTTRDAARDLWESADNSVPRTSATAWVWSDIHQGIPWVTQETQDQFVPQMANLDLIGGISFKKGCYPGQEIVARTQYLGKVKRKMYLARTIGHAAAGMEVFSEDVGGQANGMVINASPSPTGGTDLLVSVQTQSAEHSSVHLGSPDGPILEFRPLPYLSS